MTKIDELYRALAGRARFLAGLAASARAALAVGVVALALGVLAKRLSWPILGVPGVSLALVAVAAAVGFAIGRRRPVNMPAVLLRADVELRTEARLSTLHEIRDRKDLQPFAVRVTAGLPARPLTPREGLPIGRRLAIELAVAATVALAGLLAILIVATPHARAPRIPTAAQSPFLQEAAPIATASPSSGQDRIEARAESEDRAANAPASAAQLASSPSAEEAGMSGSNLPTRPQSTASLEETLQQIEERVAAEESGELSESEAAELESFEAAASAPLAEELRKLLAASTRDQVLAQVRAVLARPDITARTSTRSDGSLASADSLKPLAMATGTEGESASVAAGAATGAPETPGGPGGKYPFFEESGAATEITLVGSTLPSTIGTAGEFSYYVTKSVPVEPPAADPSAAPGAPLSLSFERATSIATERALPSDVLETVRAYFTQITEGGQ